MACVRVSTPELKCCPMCSYGTYQEPQLLEHVCSIHRYDPNFIVYCTSCLRSFTKWDSFRKHMYRGCKGIEPTPGNKETVSQGEIFEHMPEMTDGGGDLLSEEVVPTGVPLKWHAATFILSIRERHLLPQVAVDTVVSSTTSLMSNVLGDILHDLRESLPIEAVETLDRKAEDGLFNASHLFEGLSTPYLQKKFFKEHCHLVEPVRVVLGARRTWQSRKAKRRAVEVKVEFQYIPILEMLKALLSQSDVLEEILNGHSSDEVLRDVCDAKFVQTHPMFSQDQRTLLLALYYDDLEVANPLGSRRGKHKLGMFYWTLLNVHPAYRSSLRFIQLLAVAKSKDVKEYGIDAILEPAVKDLQVLARDGLSILCKGTEFHFKGTAVLFVGDTPASGYAGGFKEGVGGAFRKCRRCMVLPQQISTKFHASQLRHRTLINHKRHCELLESGMSDHFSKVYGVTRLSILDQVPHFDLCRCMPHDMMHVILEGVLPRHCKRLLIHCVNHECYFTLSLLNEQISNYPYGYSESVNAPRPIDSQCLTAVSDKLGQSASQMWLLGRMLPLMVGRYVPEDDLHWKSYLDLLQILTLATAVEVTQETISLMSMLVENYLTRYNTLYPNSMTPKLHYLVHLPEQMELFGPLRHHWCMRFEAKNAYIKRCVGKNFKNLPHSVATRHQNFMCLQLLPIPHVASSNFLYKGDEIGKAKMLCIEALPGKMKDAIQRVFPSKAFFPCTSTVTVLGTEFRLGALVCTRAPADSEYPIFGEIQHILIPSDHKIFLVQIFETLYFSQHYFAYCIDPTDTYLVIDVANIKLHDVFHKYCISSELFTVVRSCHIVELAI